jgi:F-type H+-transporting ATPase subunit b
MLDALTVVFAVTEGGEEGGSFLVSPNWGLMIWTLLVFAISMFLLRKLAWPRITEALDKRQRLIEDSIDSAQRTKDEADRLLADYRARLSEARGQADDIVARAREDAQRQQTDIVAKAREDREEVMRQARRDIQVETQRAIQEIRREVADLTVMATEKVTRKSLTGADQRRLVDEALSELDFAALSGGEERR